eukprot:2682119-Rhodomonas_salina.1
MIPSPGSPPTRVEGAGRAERVTGRRSGAQVPGAAPDDGGVGAHGRPCRRGPPPPPGPPPLPSSPISSLLASLYSGGAREGWEGAEGVGGPAQGQGPHLYAGEPRPREQAGRAQGRGELTRRRRRGQVLTRASFAELIVHVQLGAWGKKIVITISSGNYTLQDVREIVATHCFGRDLSEARFVISPPRLPAPLPPPRRAPPRPLLSPRASDWAGGARRRRERGGGEQRRVGAGADAAAERGPVGQRAAERPVLADGAAVVHARRQGPRPPNLRQPQDARLPGALLAGFTH